MVSSRLIDAKIAHTKRTGYNQNVVFGFGSPNNLASNVCFSTLISRYKGARNKNTMYMLIQYDKKIVSSYILINKLRKMFSGFVSFRLTKVKDAPTLRLLAITYKHKFTYTKFKVGVFQLVSALLRCIDLEFLPVIKNKAMTEGIKMPIKTWEEVMYLTHCIAGGGFHTANDSLVKFTYTDKAFKLTACNLYINIITKFFSKANHPKLSKKTLMSINPLRFESDTLSNRVGQTPTFDAVEQILKLEKGK